MPLPRTLFNYLPLKRGQIRLLQPSINTNDITWSLTTVSLQGQYFDALSYCWGDQSQTFSHVCNDQELLIHQNLKAALPYLVRCHKG
ncbi:hypothetical protein F4680DRAFT_441414 [Xylaria scruposa]|nr:hypothetical protein F4680DRAFT_441414 [Xylaria scruposa]